MNRNLDIVGIEMSVGLLKGLISVDFWCTLQRGQVFFSFFFYTPLICQANWMCGEKRSLSFQEALIDDHLRRKNCVAVNEKYPINYFDSTQALSIR